MGRDEKNSHVVPPGQLAQQAPLEAPPRHDHLAVPQVGDLDGRVGGIGGEASLLRLVQVLCSVGGDGLVSAANMTTRRWV